MGVVPHRTGRSNHEDAHRAEESSHPQRAEHEHVETHQGHVGVLTDCREVGVRGHVDPEVGRRDQIYHSDQTASPEREGEESLDDGYQDGSADTCDELTGRFANSDGEADSVAAAEHDDKETAADSDEGPANGGVVGRVGGNGDAHVGNHVADRVERRVVAAVVEEDNAETDQHEDCAEEGHPHDAASQAAQQEHEDEGD